MCLWKGLKEGALGPYGRSSCWFSGRASTICHCVGHVGLASVPPFRCLSLFVVLKDAETCGHLHTFAVARQPRLQHSNAWQSGRPTPVCLFGLEQSMCHQCRRPGCLDMSAVAGEATCVQLAPAKRTAQHVFSICCSCW